MTQPSPPPNVIGQLETDVFCDACLFNLHGQSVWKDDRLGIVVCRCPECGKHHPAAAMTSATTPWLRRLGVGLLVSYIAAVVLFTGLAGFTLWVCGIVHLETISWNRYYASFSSLNGDDLYTIVVAGMIAVVAAALWASVLSAVTSHASRRTRLYGVLVLPILVAFLLVVTGYSYDAHRLPRSFLHINVIGLMILHIVGVLAGLLVGPYVWRIVAGFLIPAKLRRTLGETWQ